MKQLGLLVITLVVVVLHGYSAAQTVATTAYFLPNAGTLPLVNRYRNAQKLLYVAANVITDPELTFALGRAKRRGLEIKVLLDEAQVRGNKFSVHADLIRAGIQVKIAPGMYNEFGIIDGQIVYVGSGLIHTDIKANPKFSTYLILSDSQLVRAYTKEFLSLFNNRASSP